MHYRRRNPRNPRRSKRGKRRGRRPVRRCNSKNLRLSESGCRLFARMPLSDLWIHTSGSNPSPPLRTRTWSSHGRGIVENPQFTNPAQVPTPNFNLVLNGVHGWVRASESSLARLYRHCAVHRLPPSTHRHTNADSGQSYRMGNLKRDMLRHLSRTANKKCLDLYSESSDKREMECVRLASPAKLD